MARCARVAIVYRMKYAVATWMDQTIGWATADGAATERASEAVLFDTPDAAQSAMTFDHGAWAQEVPDEAAFRAMAPTWTGRPYTLSTLFSIAREAYFAANNFDGDGGAGFYEKAQDLSMAALTVLEALGHHGEKGWAFGPRPVSTL